MKTISFLFLFLSTLSAWAQPAPNMVIYQQQAADYKAHISVKFTGELHGLKEAIGQVFQKKPNVPPRVYASGSLTTFSGISYPYVSPIPYTIEMKNGPSDEKGTIIRYFIYDSTGHYLLHSGDPMVRKFCEYIQSAVDKALKTRYTESSEKFGEIYLYEGRENMEALSSELYLYSTEESTPLVKWLINQFQFFSDSAVNLLINDSTKTGTLTGISSSVLGYEKPIAIRFGFENLNNGSLRLFFYAIPDQQKNDPDPIRLSDLHYRIRWFLLNQKP